MTRTARARDASWHGRRPQFALLTPLCHECLGVLLRCRVADAADRAADEAEAACKCAAITPSDICLSHCPRRLPSSPRPSDPILSPIPAERSAHPNCRALHCSVPYLPLPHAPLPHARRCERFSSDSRENYLFTCTHKTKKYKNVQDFQHQFAFISCMC